MRITLSYRITCIIATLIYTYSRTERESPYRVLESGFLVGVGGSTSVAIVVTLVGRVVFD
jgi:hypothetical protein